MDFLKKILEKREAELAEVKAKIQSATTADEVRSLSTKLASVNSEIEDIKAQIAAAEGRGKGPDLPKAHAENRADLRGSDEYRKAFMEFVVHGTEIPAELREDGVTTSSEVGAFVSQPIMDRVIDTVSSGEHGALFAKVSKYNLPAGVKFPLSSLSATWSWVAEDTCPNPQKAGTANSFVTFNGYLGQASIAVSLVASTMTLASFEAKLVDLIVKAFYKAMDTAIVAGTGVASPLGITKDERVTKVAQLSEADMADWTAFYSKVVSLIPSGKRNGSFVFAQPTVDGYIRTMKDQNNRPLYFEPLDIATPARLAGREVIAVDPDLIKSFDQAGVGDVIGFYGPLEDYAVNSNLQFGIRRYFDEKCNNWVTKGLVICDGKVLDPSGFVLIKKKANG